jgi:hypothetical protein
MSQDSTSKQERAGHRGPHPGIVAAVFAALFVAGIIPVTQIGSDVHFPGPIQPPEEIVAYFRTHAGNVRLFAFFQFCSAIPLAIFTATMASRLRYLGVTAAGPVIGFVGGLWAALALVASSLSSWVLSQPGIADDAGATRAFHFLAFGMGGPGYSVPLGLLIAGIAVSAGFAKLLPRWLVYSGLALAAIGELSAIDLIVPQALFLIPLTRFPAFVWFILAGFRLRKERSKPRTEGETSTAALAGAHA